MAGVEKVALSCRLKSNENFQRLVAAVSAATPGLDPARKNKNTASFAARISNDFMQKKCLIASRHREGFNAAGPVCAKPETHRTAPACGTSGFDDTGNSSRSACSTGGPARSRTLNYKCQSRRDPARGAAAEIQNKSGEPVPTRSVAT